MVLNDNDFANQTDAAEQNKIGEMYFYGNDVEQSYEEAVKWYTLAANQGDADAQCNLDKIYEKRKFKQGNMICRFFHNLR